MVVGQHGRHGVTAPLPVQKESKKERERVITQNPTTEVSHALKQSPPPRKRGAVIKRDAKVSKRSLIFYVYLCNYNTIMKSNKYIIYLFV